MDIIIIIIIQNFNLFQNLDKNQFIIKKYININLIEMQSIKNWLEGNDMFGKTVELNFD